MQNGDRKGSQAMNTLESKLSEYAEEFDAIRSFDGTMGLYQHFIEIGKRLQQDPLSEELRTEPNRVSYCQFQLFVDYEQEQWKSYSDGLISSGYAYVLTDVFNGIDLDQAAIVTPDTFDALGIQDLLSMNRATGFRQMVEIMSNTAKSKL